MRFLPAAARFLLLYPAWVTNGLQPARTPRSAPTFALDWGSTPRTGPYPLALDLFQTSNILWINYSIAKQQIGVTSVILPAFGGLLAADANGSDPSCAITQLLHLDKLSIQCGAPRFCALHCI